MPVTDEMRETQMRRYADSRDPRHLFTRLEVCGRGSYGVVFKAIDNSNGNTVALKVIDFDKVDDDLAELQREVMILALCHHPCVTQYFGSFVRRSELWISMEYLGGGSVADLLKPGPFEERYQRVILRDVLRALEYLHSQDLMHRDIKGSNVLLSENGHAKLADLGVARRLNAALDAVGARRTMVGTPLMMAPEMISGDLYGLEVDIWALGCTAYEVATGLPPNAGLPMNQAMLRTYRDDAPRLVGESYSADLRDFVERCLQKDPSQRWSAARLLTHPFVQVEDDASILRDLVVRYDAWRATHPSTTSKARVSARASAFAPEDDPHALLVAASQAALNDWNFTVETDVFFDALNRHGIAYLHPQLAAAGFDLTLCSYLDASSIDKLGISDEREVAKLLALVEELQAADDDGEDDRSDSVATEIDEKEVEKEVEKAVEKEIEKEIEKEVGAEKVETAEKAAEKGDTEAEIAAKIDIVDNDVIPAVSLPTESPAVSSPATDKKRSKSSAPSLMPPPLKKSEGKRSKRLAFMGKKKRTALESSRVDFAAEAAAVNIAAQMERSKTQLSLFLPRQGSVMQLTPTSSSPPASADIEARLNTFAVRDNKHGWRKKAQQPAQSGVESPLGSSDLRSGSRASRRSGTPGETPPPDTPLRHSTSVSTSLAAQAAEETKKGHRASNSLGSQAAGSPRRSKKLNGKAAAAASEETEAAADADVEPPSGPRPRSASLSSAQPSVAASPDTPKKKGGIAGVFHTLHRKLTVKPGAA